MSQLADDFEVIEAADVAKLAATATPPDIGRITKWLTPTDYASLSSEYNRHRGSLVPGTGQWLKETARFQEWQASPEKSFIWIKGVPGSGKSVLAASLAQTLEAESVPVLHFFFRQIIETNRTARSLLRDFLCQLLPFSPVLQTVLWENVDERKALAEVSTSQLWKYLRTALGAAEKVFCVIDALDEMDYDEDFLARLNSLGTFKPGHVKIVATSRPKQYLQRALKDPAVIHISLEEECVKRDIQCFVENRLRSLSVDDETRDYLISIICGRSNGLFLYARLMLDDIAAEADPATMRTTASKLPLGLEEMYNSVLFERSISTGIDERIQVVILKLVTQSARPLRLVEIAKAIERHVLYPAEMSSKEVVRKACGPLLEIMEDEIVQIIHHSLTEFLVNKDREQLPGHQFPVIDPVNAHRDVALLCLSYLQVEDVFSSYEEKKLETDFWGMPSDAGGFVQFDFKPILLKYPLTQYAAKYWPYHARCYGIADTKLLDAIVQFSKTSKPQFAAWCNFLSSDTEQEVSSHNATALHAAAGFGLAFWVEHLIKESAELDALDWNENSPLFYAANCGYEKVVSLLIQAGASPNIESYNGLIPIHTSASRNHSAVVRLLLEAGVSPTTPRTKEVGNWCGNASTSLGDHGLMYASTSGHVETVMEMLPYLEIEEIEQSLCWAAEGGHYELMKALFDKTAVSPDAAATGQCGKKGAAGHRGRHIGEGRTALYLSTCSLQPRCVELLLQKGADVHKTSNVSYHGLVIGVRTCDDSTVLHGLADSPPQRGNINAWEKIMHILLDAGADLEAKNGQGRTPLLHSSACHGPNPGFCAMLHAGADPCVIGKDGKGILHSVASTKDLPELITLLLERGVNLDQVDSGEGKSAMHLLASCQKLENMKILVEHGVNVGAKDFEGNTPLHLACKLDSREKFDIMTYLLANGADVNAMNKAGQTCFHNLGRNSSETVGHTVKLLAEAGMKFDLLDSNGKTGLHTAIYEQPDCLEPILQNIPSAHISTRTQSGKSVLHLACQRTRYTQHERVKSVQLLIQYGADVKWTDVNRNTLLHEAAAGFEGTKGDFQLVQALIELGVPMSAPNNHQQSALHLNPTTRRYVDEPIRHSLVSIFQQHDAQICIDPTDCEGNTPLHAAAGNEIVAFGLISAGANVNARSHQLETPLHCAARLGCSGVVSMLLHFGATVTADAFGHTPLYMACSVGDPASVRLLIDAGAEISTAVIGICLHTERDARDGDKLALRNEIVKILRAAGGQNLRFEGTHSLSRVRPDVLEDILENHPEGPNIPGFKADRADRCYAYAKLLDYIPSMSCAELEDLLSKDVDFAIPFERWTNKPATPISYMASHGLTDLILPIIERVRDFDSGDFVKEISLDEYFQLKIFPIIQHVCAGSTRNMDMLQLLVEYGMNVNARRLGRQRDVIDGNGYTLGATALHVLAMGDNWWQAEATEYLVRAGKSNSRPCLILLMDPGAQTEAADVNGRSALHYASMSSRPTYDIPASARFFRFQVCQALLKSGANPNHVDLDGMSPLDLAEDLRTIELLLQYGADIKLGTKNPIMRAIESHKPDLLRLYLENGGDCNAPDRSVPNKDEFTRYPIIALFWNYGDEDEEMAEMLRLLLQHEVKLDITIEEKMVIHLIFEFSQPADLAPFLERRYFDPNLRDPDGRTVFLAACGHKQTKPSAKDLACVLLAESEHYQDIDLEAVDNKGRHMGFHLLNCWSEKTVARFSKELRTLVPQKDKLGFSCLSRALKCHNTNAALQMIEYGGDLWEADPNGDFALHHLCRLGHGTNSLYTQEMLIQKFLSKASINARNQLGETALHVFLTTTSGRRERDELYLLISNGADAFAKDNRGETMLHRIANRKSYLSMYPGSIDREGDYNLELFQRFVGYGCDPLQEDNQGISALDVAAAAKNQQILAAYQRKSVDDLPL